MGSQIRCRVVVVVVVDVVVTVYCNNGKVLLLHLDVLYYK